MELRADEELSRAELLGVMRGYRRSFRMLDAKRLAKRAEAEERAQKFAAQGRALQEQIRSDPLPRSAQKDFESLRTATALKRKQRQSALARAQGRRLDDEFENHQGGAEVAALRAKVAVQTAQLRQRDGPWLANEARAASVRDTRAGV